MPDTLREVGCLLYVYEYLISRVAALLLPAVYFHGIVKLDPIAAKSMAKHTEMSPIHELHRCLYFISSECNRQECLAST